MRRKTALQAILAMLGTALLVISIVFIVDKVYGRRSQNTTPFDFIESISNAINYNNNPSLSTGTQTTVTVRPTIWQTIVYIFTTSKSVQIMSVFTTLVLVSAAVFVVYWTTLQQQVEIIPEKEDPEKVPDVPVEEDLVDEDEEVSNAILVPFVALFVVVVVTVLSGKTVGWADRRGLFKRLPGEAEFVMPVKDDKAQILEPAKPAAPVEDLENSPIVAFFAQLSRDNTAAITSNFKPQYYSLTTAPTNPDLIPQFQRTQQNPFKVRYTQGSELGSGGYGTVFAATRNDPSNQEVAIKRIAIPDSKADLVIKELMLQEAKLMAHFSAVDPQHFVQVYEQFYETENSELRWLYIVMEKLNGVTLKREMNLDRKNVAVLARELLAAVSNIHAAGWRHRDIKPENVFVIRDGQVKLLDFGLASPIGDSLRCGSPGFYSPEMICGPWTIDQYVPIATIMVNNHGANVPYHLTLQDKFEIMDRCRKYEATDIFSLGHTLQTLHPFDDDPLFREMIGLMRQVEPWKRPTAATLLNHPFITANAPAGVMFDISKLVV